MRGEGESRKRTNPSRDGQNLVKAPVSGRPNWFPLKFFAACIGVRIQRLDVTDQLPALRFWKLGPHRHASADYSVAQEPEKGARRALLHFVGHEAGGLLAALGHFPVTLGTVQGEQLSAAGNGIRIILQR